MIVYIKTFGCRVNQVESESILEELLQLGHTITHDFKEAHLCILNTCTVTHNADKDVEKFASQITRHNPAARLILTGCYAAAHGERIKEKFPKAQIIFKLNIGKELLGKDIEWTVRAHEGHSRAFIKIQDGCDCFCSYCIIPYTRSQKTSKPKRIVLKEIEQLVANGYQEIVLTGINIGNYLCPETGANLAKLLPEVFKIEGNFRVRFSSIELNTVTDELLDAAQNPKFCHYLHLPLQSGSDAVLKDMNRHYTTAQYFEKVQDLRRRFSNLGLYCDIIAGYPTETQQHFEEACAFIKKVNFAGMHVFSYSVRPNTVAGKLPQHTPQIIKERADKLRQIDAELRQAFAATQIGVEQQVLAEDFSLDKGLLSGVCGNFQRVIIPVQSGQKGLVRVKITAAADGLCTGKLNLV